MAMKFQYDEQGDTFMYFVLAFLVLLLLPSTYYLWPRAEEKDADKQGFKCGCDNCEHKRSKLRASQPKKKLRKHLIKFLLVAGWIVTAFIAYTVATTKREVIDWNPYEILELEPGASVEEIKKQYRKLSRVYHPDRGGDEKKFINITKAHAALTDDTARENWEKYGNPDGPGVTEFGIALPIWLVQGKSSIWVLALYGVIFLILMPTVVGIWWYRSIRYTSESVLIETTKIIRYYFLRSRSTLNVKRLLLILTGAREFDATLNEEIKQRPDDNDFLPIMLKTLGNVQEKIKEIPFGAPYSVKARTLLLAHLERMELPAPYLREDLDYILKRCPMLIGEMINTCSIIMAWYYQRQVPHMPTLDTVENVMKLSQLLVQGLAEHASPLQQLPNLDAEILRHFHVKKRNIKSMVQFLRFPAEDRRNLLRSLTDKQYNDVVSVCSAMPHVEVTVALKVVDDEDENTVTSGAIVTVNVTLKRINLGDWVETVQEEKEKAEENEIAVAESSKAAGNTKSAYRRNKKKAKGKKGQASSKGKTDKNKKSQNDVKENGTVPTTSGEKEAKKGKKEEVGDKDEEESESAGSESGSESDKENEEKESVHEKADDENDHSSGDEGDISDKELVRDQSSSDDKDYLDIGDEDQNIIPEVKSKVSHPVHCPYFPEEKQEWWWVYLVDKKTRRLVAPPTMVTSLVTEESLQLKFNAGEPATYNYSVVVKSDSYLDVDTVTNLKFEVKQAKEMDMNNPQWDMLESDEEKEAEEDNIYASETETESEEE